MLRQHRFSDADILLFAIASPHPAADRHRRLLQRLSDDVDQRRAVMGHRDADRRFGFYDLARSKDKTLAFVEGATHGYTTCTKCERTPGEFGDTQKTTYDYIDQWLSKPGRFLAPR